MTRAAAREPNCCHVDLSAERIEHGQRNIRKAADRQPPDAAACHARCPCTGQLSWLASSVRTPERDAPNLFVVSAMRPYRKLDATRSRCAPLVSLVIATHWRRIRAASPSGHRYLRRMTPPARLPGRRAATQAGPRKEPTRAAPCRSGASRRRGRLGRSPQTRPLTYPGPARRRIMATGTCKRPAEFCQPYDLP